MCEYCKSRKSYFDENEIPNASVTAYLHPYQNNLLVEYRACKDGEMFTKISLQVPITHCPWCGKKLKKP